jgi:hypothetical protein
LNFQVEQTNFAAVTTLLFEVAMRLMMTFNPQV